MSTSLFEKKWVGMSTQTHVPTKTFIVTHTFSTLEKVMKVLGSNERGIKKANVCSDFGKGIVL